MSSGYVPAEDRVEEPAVVEAVDPARAAASSSESLAAYGWSRLSVIPTCDAGRVAPQDLDRAAVREQQVMRGRERVRVRPCGPARGGPSRARPTTTTHGSLCVIQWPTRSPSRADDRLDVLGERVDRRRARASRPHLRAPAACPSGRASRTARCRCRAARRRGGRRSRARPAFTRPRPLGQHPRPRDREPERVEPELAHQGDVLAVAVVEVARDRAVVAVANLARASRRSDPRRSRRGRPRSPRPRSGTTRSPRPRRSRRERSSELARHGVPLGWQVRGQ